VPMRAVLTAMDEPLGRTVGNALEVVESIDCLTGAGPADTMEVTYALGEQMLLLAKVAATPAEARKQLEATIKSGSALAKFKELVAAQGGDARVADDVTRLPQAKLKVALPAARAGFVQDVDAMGVALAALRLGAGRAKAEDKVDHAVGVADLVKVGEKIAAGTPLCTIHANDDKALAEAKRMLEKVIVVGDTPGKAPKLIDEIIS
jgi:pyrimidine-nucleoside phosphorylase